MFGHQDNSVPQSSDNGMMAGPAIPPLPPDTSSPAYTTAMPPNDAAAPVDLTAPSPDASYTSMPTPQDDVPKLTAGTEDLLTIKQEALQQLAPLVNHLEQTPEEKFRTTMMMLQASDDQSLIQAAYQAAQSITDEKQRAQALLDVVNEINYFTRHTEGQ